jgi:hypothetical protein
LTFTGAGSLSYRYFPVGFATIGYIQFTQSIALLVAGVKSASTVSHNLLVFAGVNHGLFITIGRLLFLFGGGILSVLSFNTPKPIRILFPIGYYLILITTLTFTSAVEKISLIQTGVGQRLFLAPNIILGWMLLAGIDLPGIIKKQKLFPRLMSWINLVILCLALIWGIANFFNNWVPAGHWPDWKKEVQVWRSNQDYHLKIQPDGWYINLNTGE